MLVPVDTTSMAASPGHLIALAMLFGFALASHGPAARDRALVAAASDVKFAIEEIAAQFGAETGHQIDLVLGSSGNLTRQTIDGAPFELFLSADESYVDRLVRAGVTRDRGVLYGIGRIAVFAPHGSPLAVDERLDGLRRLLSQGGVPRFAIANPEHAPYGRAAEAALRATGLWEAIRPALVLGENVVQASQFASTRPAVGGIVAYSLVLAPPLTDRGTFALLPAELHPPLRQRMVLLGRAGETAGRFYTYLQQPRARAVLRRFGFAPPDE